MQYSKPKRKKRKQKRKGKRRKLGQQEWKLTAKELLKPLHLTKNRMISYSFRPPQPLPLRRPWKLSSWRFSSWFLMPTKTFIRLRLVFTSDGVGGGIVGGVVRALMILWQSKIGVMSWTASWARRNRSQNGIRTFPSGPYTLVSIFFRLSLWLRRFVVGVVVVTTLCDWFGSSAGARDSGNLVFTCS